MAKESVTRWEVGGKERGGEGGEGEEEREGGEEVRGGEGREEREREVACIKKKASVSLSKSSVHEP